jgi:hypothetical protein
MRGKTLSERTLGDAKLEMPINTHVGDMQPRGIRLERSLTAAGSCASH